MQNQNSAPLANFGGQVAFKAQTIVKLSVRPVPAPGSGKKIPPPVSPKPKIINGSPVYLKSQVGQNDKVNNNEIDTRKAGVPVYDQVKIRRPSSETNGDVKQSPNKEYPYAVPKLHLKQNRTKRSEEEGVIANRKENLEETSTKDKPRESRKKSIVDELDELEYLAKAAQIEENRVENVSKSGENQIKQRSLNRDRSRSIEQELAELQSLTDLLELETSPIKKDAPQNIIEKEQPKENPEPEGKKDVGDVAGELDELTNMLIQGLDDISKLEEKMGERPSDDVPEEVKMGACFKCKQEINSAGTGCTALGSTYHIDCFKCGKCDDVKLVGKEFFVVGNVPHCDNCYKETLEECAICSQKIADKILHAVGCSFHPHCFKCSACEKMLDTLPFILDDDKQPHCVNCYQLKFSPKCAICDNIITSQNEKGETTPHIVSMEKNFHVDCYKCEDCGMKLSSEIEGHGCYPLDGRLLCLNCNGKKLRDLKL